MQNLSSPAAVAAILRRYNLRPQRRLGQNFLVDGNILTKICDAAELKDGVSVLEIGPGLGVLTSSLAERVGASGRVLAIEIDRSILPALHDTVRELNQVTVVNADALAVDFDSAVEDHCLTNPLHVVANIPYQITSPLIAKFLEMQQPIASIVLLVQREVATRLAAKAGTSDYGAFSVFVQYHCAVEFIGTVSPSCFFPPPEVTSAIIRLRPYKQLPVAVSSPELLFKIVRAAFGQRRKTLLNALSNDPTLAWSKEQAQQALTTAKIDPGRRGETLTLNEFASLATL